MAVWTLLQLEWAFVYRILVLEGVVKCQNVKSCFLNLRSISHFFSKLNKARALFAVDSFTSRAADKRGYDHCGQHSWADHAHSASVDPRIISWVHRTPQRWAKQDAAGFATARRHAEAATSATEKIVGGVPLRCPSLAPPVQTAAPSSDARDTCHVRRNLSTQVKYFFHAERSGLMGKQLFGAVRSAPEGDDERFIKRFAQGKWQVRTCAPDAPDADRVRVRVLGHGAPAPARPAVEAHHQPVVDVSKKVRCMRHLNE